MQTSLLILGIILALVSHWRHHQALKQLRQTGNRLTGQSARNRIIYHGLLYLGLLYAAVGVWQPAWRNTRVIGLLLLVDAVALSLSWYQAHRRQYPVAVRRLGHRQAWYLTGSQLLLGAVLLGSLLGTAN